VEKLTIVAELQTPIITGGGYMTFDALLAGVLFDQLQDVEAAHEAVPIKSTDGLFHASAAFYDPIEVGRTSFVANLRADHSLDADLFPRKKDGSIYKKLGRLKRQHYGAVMNTYDCITTDRIEWFVEGDKEDIEPLTADIHFIGKRRASGFGEIKKWLVEPGELAGLMGLMKEPLRPIPVERFTGDTSAIKADTGWRPAYWHPTNRAICYVPEVH
jgi:hypothetical protein